MSAPGSSGAGRTLTTLFVRPAVQRALPPIYRFAIARDRAETLPLGLVRLASVVKFGSGHRVAIHDAALEPGGNRGLRSVAALFRPDAAVLWLHPAFLGDGLEAARAVRQAGCELVVGTGPLVDLWPEGAARIPELDALLSSNGRSALLQALDVLARGGDSAELRQALSGPSLARVDLPVDRKLVDYAGYCRGAGAPWPPEAPSPAPMRPWIPERLRRRDAAASVSPVFLHGEDGELLPPEAVLDDIDACKLLGIQSLDLVCRPLCPPPDDRWLGELLPGLRHGGGAAPSPLRIRLAVDPSAFSDLPLLDLPHLGVVAVDFGEVPAGDEEALSAGLEAARACRRQNLQPTGTLVLGRPGYAPDVELRGLERTLGEGFPTTAGVEVRLGTVDPSAWSDWLDAPTPEFQPPGLSDESAELAERARRALLVVPPGRTRLRSLLWRAIRSRP